MIVFEMLWEERGELRRQTIDPRDMYGRGPMMQATEPQHGATDFRKRPDGVWEMPE